MPQFDYIIAGAGAAGLSLLMRILASPVLSKKKILLIDRAPKINNDRTWCFWETGSGFFEPIVHKKWKQLEVHGNGYSARHSIEPYQYKLIRGIDFYRHCFDTINTFPNVTIKYATIERIISTEEETHIESGNEKISASYVFSSIHPTPSPLRKGEFFLKQHFKGWTIETDIPVFDPEIATLMDFRMDQQHGTTFVYVMPFTPSRALVEYTLFSKELLTAPEYDTALKEYIARHYKAVQYKVLEEEFGVIPMTNVPFISQLNNVIYIGTAGGQTKPSSGYTFQFIQKHSTRIVQSLEENGTPFFKKSLVAKRFHLYDSTLLNILANRKMEGAIIFTDLFRKNNFTDVLQFLDNETSLLQEMRMITVLPKKLFLRAALQQLL
ncbi:MAG TPA: lycopene cyclase family protein [Flavitalea sp.]|nr:lycopene cyclase family protein [Flavitalea sp.]